MTKSLSIIIPTKDRCETLKQLLVSIKELKGLERIQPEIIVGENGSKDETWAMLQEEASQFPVRLHTLRVNRPGKCAVLNEAMRVVRGELVALLDDDVLLDPGWLEAIEAFFRENDYPAAQGVVRIQSPDSEDPEILTLLQRYRTIPHVEYSPDAKEVHSLNGANMVIHRKVFTQVGDFDERLGPGASGTSEDVELALRLTRRGIKIGYINNAIVYHSVDRSRLTEAYFKLIHKRQGQSRLLFKNPRTGRILWDLARAAAQYGLHSLTGSERKKYRGKGRVYHYLGMLEIKLKPGGKG